jgi:hypothetical protein
MPTAFRRARQDRKDSADDEDQRRCAEDLRKLVDVSAFSPSDGRFGSDFLSFRGSPTCFPGDFIRFGTLSAGLGRLLTSLGRFFAGLGANYVASDDHYVA